MKYDKDTLYLIVDFLEEQLEESRFSDYSGYDDDELLGFEEKETMFETTIEVIKSLIKE